MMCPRCVDALLVERSLESVAVDVCPSCQGIWLDRGELQRLREREDAVDARSPTQSLDPMTDDAPRRRRDRDDEDDDDEDFDLRRRRQGSRGDGERRSGGWRGLLDLFG